MGGKSKIRKSKFEIRNLGASAPLHHRLDVVGRRRQLRREVLRTILGDEEIVLDPHPELLVGKVDPGLVGEHHSRHEQRFVGGSGVMGVEAELVAETVNEILAELLACLLYTSDAADDLA